MAGQAAGNASCHLATGVPEMSMIPDETPTAPARGIGDNQPPSPIETLVTAQKEAQTKALEERLAYIVGRSEEHTSELQSLMRISYAVFCLKKKTTQHQISHISI